MTRETYPLLRRLRPDLFREEQTRTGAPLVSREPEWRRRARAGELRAKELGR
jgi:hypothetical protein